MPFSRCLLLPCVHSFDNRSVFCANIGQCALLCIFDAKAVENRLILSKPHSGAGLLAGHFY